MTRDEAREFAKVVQAYADGKSIQVRAIRNLHWNDVVVEPSFNAENVEWRVKPEPREWWIVILNTGRVTGTFEKCSDAEFVQRAYPLARVAHVREVME